MAFRRGGRERLLPADRRLSGGSMGRILILVLLFGVLTFALLLARLCQLQLLWHGELEDRAISQQTRKVDASPGRGTIYGAGGEVLAVSASAQNVILSPRDVLALAREGSEGEEERLRKKEELFTLISSGLAEILETEEEKILRRLEKTNSAWETLARKVEEERADQVRAFVAQHGLERCVYLTTDARRCYPYGDLACHVLGFVNGEDRGAYGLEALFDEELAGKKGRVLTARNAAGAEMPAPYSQLVEGTPGCDVHTTIDPVIQRFAEKILEEGIEKFEVTQGGFCLVAEPSTGAILALASYPDYDPNRPAEVTDPIALADLEAEGGTEETLAQARFLQWRSKCLNTAYEPGSTFKPLVMAAALEEGAVTPENRFHCGGVLNVGGWPIRCSKRTGHGSQSLEEALMNSCNPAFIQIGQRLGAERFYAYWQAYGFEEKTGIELPGEERSRFWPTEEFLSPNGLTSLATASFGQRFLVTPIQLVKALSAVVNGGELMEPYLVASVTDPSGRTILRREPRVIRRVISEETSARMRAFLKSVVEEGTGKNARQEGYSIGGKTGSSQTGEADHTIVSFVGFAPAEDPAFLVLLGYDCPRPALPGATLTAGGVYISGGNMAAPMAGELIADILNYLGYPREGEGTQGDCAVPDLEGLDLQDAQAALEELGLALRTQGEGSRVAGQIPGPGARIPQGSTVVLELGEDVEQRDLAEAPDPEGEGGAAQSEVPS